jgi:hypothetical protein
VLLLLVATVGSGWWLHRQGAPLVDPEVAPRGGLSLQLSPSTSAARDILEHWASASHPRRLALDGRPEPLTETFLRLLQVDTWFIALYSLTLLLALWWGTREIGASQRVSLALAGLVVAAAGCDLVENRLLASAVRSGADDATIALARLMAQCKFIGLLPPVLRVIALAGSTLRRQRGASGPAPQPPARTFSALVQDEMAGIARRSARVEDAPYVPAEHASEPWVTFRSADIVGLALSGGGIRSATFNLGLLQQLTECRVLRLVDYLSTVSGGGYIGGFFSAWLKDKAPTRDGAVLFPGSPRWSGPSFAVGVPEAGEVRHLREFSGFLVPRRGLFQVEMWRGIVAVLAGLMPALLIALSVIAAALFAWLALTFAYACDRRMASVLVAVAIAAVVIVLFEAWRPAGDPGAPAAAPRGAYLVTSVVAVVLVGAVQLSLPSVHERVFGHAAPLLVPREGDGSRWLQARAPRGDGAYERWWDVIGMTAAPGEIFISPRLFDFAVTWTTAAAVLLLLRLAHAAGPRPWRREALSAFDRVVMRLLGLATAWLAFAVMWHLCVTHGWLWGMLIPTILSAAAFAATRNWIAGLGRKTAQGSPLSRFARYVPQALAYVTILLATAGLGSGLIRLNGTDWFAWYGSAALTGVVLVVGLLIDPSHFGLHAFYRDRIGRAYLGARRTANAVANRSTEMQDADDVALGDLPERPLHLVCCAANDLSGDPVETLSRGARSATLSRYGFTIAGDHVETPDLTLGAAVTASAAAFNSNMGTVSVRLGPVVGFLLTALNLRLGLWVRHPRAAPTGVRRWPGLLLYREMLSLTSASGYVSDPGSGKPAELTVLQRDVHLSDGGHFENLGLYELIRRHCRYVIVSDCGADPDVEFDDLGNALRRIREDFGVDIDIDIEPLRPDATGRSRQHVAIGSINYSSVDRGVLVYIKPSITGDEPPDVLQYKARNAAFPHESTGDQFYDEAQWESYRRLGQHSATRVFSFIREAGAPAELTADWVFAEARAAWYPTPAGLEERVVAMTTRFGQLENELRTERTSGLLREVFPELLQIGSPLLKEAPPATAASAASDLVFVLRAIQAMEDVWIACQLDRHWEHPLNLGWVNLFARWTTARTFRQWWPLLASMYSPGFRRFIEHRFALRSRRHGPPVVEPRPQPPCGLAAQWWRERSAQPRRWAEQPEAFTMFALSVTVDGAEGRPPESLELGLTAVTRHGPLAGWTSDDFFVPPSLWGAGFGSQMLRGVLDALAEECEKCYVCVRAPQLDADHVVARADERGFVEQYRKVHFQQLAWDHWTHAPEIRGELMALGLPVRPDDTLLTLDLTRWKDLRARRYAPAQKW